MVTYDDVVHGELWWYYDDNNNDDDLILVYDHVG
jgi:hypothetical protein